MEQIDDLDSKSDDDEEEEEVPQENQQADAPWIEVQQPKKVLWGGCHNNLSLLFLCKACQKMLGGCPSICFWLLGRHQHILFFLIKAGQGSPVVGYHLGLLTSWDYESKFWGFVCVASFVFHWSTSAGWHITHNTSSILDEFSGYKARCLVVLDNMVQHNYWVYSYFIL